MSESVVRAMLQPLIYLDEATLGDLGDYIPESG